MIIGGATAGSSILIAERGLKMTIPTLESSAEHTSLGHDLQIRLCRKIEGRILAGL